MYQALQQTKEKTGFGEYLNSSEWAFNRYICYDDDS